MTVQEIRHKAFLEDAPLKVDAIFWKDHLEWVKVYPPDMTELGDMDSSRYMEKARELFPELEFCYEGEDGSECFSFLGAWTDILARRRLNVPALH